MNVRCWHCRGTRIARIVGASGKKETIDCAFCDGAGRVPLMKHLVDRRVQQFKRVRDRIVWWIKGG